MDPAPILLLLLLLFLSAFFSGSESAYLSINPLKFQTLAKTSPAAARVLKLREKTDRLIIVMLITSNLANIAATALITVAATEAFGDAGLGIATGVMTLLILIFGEIVPKNIAISHATKVALMTAPIFQFLMFVLTPIVIGFELISKLAMKLFGGDEGKKMYSEGDLKTLVEVGVSENQVEEEDRRRIEGILNFDDLDASDVMTPRLKMYVLPSTQSLEDAYNEVVSSGYSRIPVIAEDKDHVVGILHLKDFLEAYIDADRSRKISEFAIPPLFIGEYETIDDVFKLFQKERRHLAIVQDEYGGTAGLVSMEDLIEEITGDIFDETDKGEPKQIRQTSKNILLVQTDVELEKINELLGIDLHRDADYNTIGGYLMSHTDGIIQEVGHREVIGNLEFEVLETQRNQPSRLKVRKITRKGEQNS